MQVTHQEALALFTEFYKVKIAAAEITAEELPPPYLLHNDIIVLPPYYDGHLGFQAALLWKFQDVWSARNSFGEVLQGTDLNDLFEFMFDV